MATQSLTFLKTSGEGVVSRRSFLRTVAAGAAGLGVLGWKDAIAQQADELRRQVLQRLVDHEVYVARFYLKADHPKAAAGRLEGAIKRYPGSGREPELLYSLGETYLHMCEPQRAKETFARVVAEYGSAPQARRSELYL